MDFPVANKRPQMLPFMARSVTGSRGARSRNHAPLLHARLLRFDDFEIQREVVEQAEQLAQF